MLANHFDGFFRYCCLLIFAALMVIGCGKDQTSPTKKPAMQQPSGAMSKNTGPAFLESVETNAEVPADLESLVFKDTQGQDVALQSFFGKKPVVLVFTQGFSGSLCPLCITQVSRLIANYSSFEERNAQILVVYPGKRDHLSDFVSAAQSGNSNVADVPFPLLLDEDLAAAKFFKIESKLAHPSTFIIDKSGSIKLAFVGADRSAERPSIKAMLDVLDSSS